MFAGVAQRRRPIKCGGSVPRGPELGDAMQDQIVGAAQIVRFGKSRRREWIDAHQCREQMGEDDFAIIGIGGAERILNPGQELCGVVLNAGSHPP